MAHAELNQQIELNSQKTSKGSKLSNLAKLMKALILAGMMTQMQGGSTVSCGQFEGQKRNELPHGNSISPKDPYATNFVMEGKVYKVNFHQLVSNVQHAEFSSPNNNVGIAVTNRGKYYFLAGSAVYRLQFVEQFESVNISRITSIGDEGGAMLITSQSGDSPPQSRVLLYRNNRLTFINVPSSLDWEMIYYNGDLFAIHNSKSGSKLYRLNLNTGVLEPYLNLGSDHWKFYYYSNDKSGLILILVKSSGDQTQGQPGAELSSQVDWYVIKDNNVTRMREQDVPLPDTNPQNPPLHNLYWCPVGNSDLSLICLYRGFEEGTNIPIAVANGAVVSNRNGIYFCSPDNNLFFGQISRDNSVDSNTLREWERIKKLGEEFNKVVDELTSLVGDLFESYDITFENSEDLNLPEEIKMRLRGIVDDYSRKHPGFSIRILDDPFQYHKRIPTFIEVSYDENNRMGIGPGVAFPIE